MPKTRSSAPATLTALCSALTVPDGDVPEWVHLLPAGAIETLDGRGPYRVASMSAIAARLAPGDKLPLDECHAADRAAPLGQPAPARGWIVALEAREDGLWGKVEWTAHGRQLMEDRAYRGISPVIAHSADNQVQAVLRASLINTPNLKGLTALHSSESEEEGTPGMDWKAKLIALLGLDSAADDAAIEVALTAKMEGAQVALQSELLAHPTVVALQAQVTRVTDDFGKLKDQVARDTATAVVDAAIADGKVGIAPIRDQYIAMHMANPADTVKLIAALPAIGGAVVTGNAPAGEDHGGLSEGQRQVIALMGLNEDEYAASLKASGLQKEAL